MDEIVLDLAKTPWREEIFSVCTHDSADDPVFLTGLPNPATSVPAVLHALEKGSAIPARARLAADPVAAR
jgi:hypothetical protein